MLWQRYAEIKPTDIALKFELKQQVKAGMKPFSIDERDLTWRAPIQLIEQWARCLASRRCEFRERRC